jgi:hypothetical protein
MLREIVAAIAAFFTTIVGVLGVNSWRRRLHGTTEYQVAFKVLETVYAVREAMEEARARHASPPDLTPEGLAPAPHVFEGDGEADVVASAQAYREKLVHVGDARERLLLVQREAFALWGEPAAEALAGIYDTIQALYSASERYFDLALDLARRTARSGRSEEPDAEMLAMRRILYAAPDATGKDPFGERMKRATAAAEEFYREYLR